MAFLLFIFYFYFLTKKSFQMATTRVASGSVLNGPKKKRKSKNSQGFFSCSIRNHPRPPPLKIFLNYY